MIRNILLLVAVCGLSCPMLFGVSTDEIQYSDGDQAFTGFLAIPDGEEPVPGILVVHEWWGHNDYARSRAEKLAGLGYVAMALDMYGEGKQADHPKDAGSFSTQIMSDGELMQRRFLAALEKLRDHPRVSSEKLGAIGYCFGGAVVLNMARAGIGLEGVVSFHGSLQAVVEPVNPMETRILVCHGAEDHFSPDEAVQSFKREMDAAGADYEFISYPGAKHSFTNPEAEKKAATHGLDIAYSASADQASWEDMKRFFEETFED